MYTCHHKMTMKMMIRDLSVLAKSWKGNSLLEGALWSFLINRQKLCLHSVLLTKMHCGCFKSSIVYIHEFPEHSCISWCVTVTCRSVGKCDTIGKTVYQVTRMHVHTGKYY